MEDEGTSDSKEWEPGERFRIVEDEDASASEELEPEVRFGYDPDRRGCIWTEDEADLEQTIFLYSVFCIL